MRICADRGKIDAVDSVAEFSEGGGRGLEGVGTVPGSGDKDEFCFRHCCDVGRCSGSI